MKKIIIGILLFIIAVSSYFLIIAPQVNKMGSFATVNGVEITASSYNLEITKSQNFYKFQKLKAPDANIIQQNVKEKLISESLIVQYAQKHKITVADSELLGRYAETVEGFNKRNNILGVDDKMFLNKINEMYGTNKSDYLQTLKMDILKEKVQESVKLPLSAWLMEQKKTAQISK